LSIWSVVEIRRTSTVESMIVENPFTLAESDSNYIHVMNLHDSATSIRSIDANFLMGSSDDQIEFLERLMSRIWMTDGVPMENRIDSALIDSVLKESFQSAGTTLDYDYGVKSAGIDTLLISTTDQIDNLTNSDYRVNLFPYDFGSRGAELLIHFSERDIFIWKQVVPILVTIIILMTIILLTFIYTLKIIINQKRSAVLMTEFVNNMTHEFKTPISTISLAAEAINRDDLIEDKKQVGQFAQMILAENNRMRRQTDKILQMATLENNNHTLKSDRLNIHQIIAEAVSHIELHIQNKEGSIISELMAERHILNGDAVHISGIIYNLLDNAVKYSPEKPEIKISTINANNGIYIRVIDKGIGIKNDDVKHVFNKYFRVSTGNRHDVKGFGLGLSYVKLMTEAHGGNINIKSQFGQGTRVEIFLPIKDGADA